MSSRPILKYDPTRENIIVKSGDIVPEFFPPPKKILIVPVYDDPPPSEYTSELDGSELSYVDDADRSNVAEEERYRRDYTPTRYSERDGDNYRGPYRRSYYPSDLRDRDSDYDYSDYDSRASWHEYPRARHPLPRRGYDERDYYDDYSPGRRYEGGRHDGSRPYSTHDSVDSYSYRNSDDDEGSRGRHSERHLHRPHEHLNPPHDTHDTSHHRDEHHADTRHDAPHPHESHSAPQPVVPSSQREQLPAHRHESDYASQPVVPSSSQHDQFPSHRHESHYASQPLVPSSQHDQFPSHRHESHYASQPLVPSSQHDQFPAHPHESHYASQPIIPSSFQHDQLPAHPHESHYASQAFIPSSSQHDQLPVHPHESHYTSHALIPSSSQHDQLPAHPHESRYASKAVVSSSSRHGAPSISSAGASNFIHASRGHEGHGEGLLSELESYLKILPPAHNFIHSKCTGRKKAVCIGINYVGQSHELKGCANDARSMRSFLISHYDFKPQDVIMLTDDGDASSSALPTRQEMLSAMNWLVEGAQQHDSLFIHYSGHGGQTPSKDNLSNESDGKDEVIFPLDFQTAGDIVDNVLHDVLVHPLPAGCRLTALFDSCHSGTVLDLPYLHSAHGRLRGLHHISLRCRNKGVAPSADVICFAACLDNETSADTFNGGVATGAMSYAFVQNLVNNPHQTYEALLELLRHTLVPKYHQKPQISGTHPLDLKRQFTL